MGDWYVLSLACLVLFGLQRFLYKVAAERRCNTAWTTFSFMGTVAALGAIMFWIVEGGAVAEPGFLLLISAVNSLTFFADTVATIEALKYVDAAVAYPVLRLNLVLVVVFSVLYFGDVLSPLQVAGIVTALAVIATLTRGGEREKRSGKSRSRGFLLLALALLAGAASAVSCKFAALRTSPLAFIAVSYAMSMALSLGLRQILGRRDDNPRHGEALVLGSLIGIVNFAGFYSLLAALARGPMSVVMTVTGMYFVVAVALSALVFRERMDAFRIAGLVLTVAAILLMRAPAGQTVP